MKISKIENKIHSIKIKIKTKNTKKKLAIK